MLCYGLSTPVHKECIKLVSQYTDELVDMIVHEYPPKYEGKKIHFEISIPFSA